MSARSVAEHALTVYFADSKDPAGMARQVLGAYAHELAEEIMALRSTVPELKARQLFKNGYDAALLVAAFTVSPEVSNDDG